MITISDGVCVVQGVGVVLPKVVLFRLFARIVFLGGDIFLFPAELRVFTLSVPLSLLINKDFRRTRIYFSFIARSNFCKMCPFSKITI